MTNACIGLVVDREPYSDPAGREQLDPALAAASLDLPVRVFFIGDGVLHLLPGQQPQYLPVAAFSRGWCALDSLSDDVRLFADSDAVEQICGGKPLQAPVSLLDTRSIAAEMRTCKVILHV